MSKSSLISLYKIVARKISGQATYGENQEFNRWIDSSQNAKDTYSDFERIWGERYFFEEDLELVSQKEAREKIWKSSFEKEENAKSRRPNLSAIIKFAAVFFIFLTTAFAVFHTIYEQKEVKPQATIINKQTLPGQKSTVTLRDGTEVILNSGSNISYSSDFNDSLRIIELEGQAFFEIFKDKTKPFIVKCRNLEVEALGTSFDVNGYNNSSIKVSLLSGSVRVSVSSENDFNELVLSPGEYSIVNSEDKLINHGKFNPYEVLAWKEGRLIFKNEKISEIIPKLELWYGVTIHLDSRVNSNKHFNSTFEKDNLYNILMNMGAVLDFDYKIEGNKVTITQKQMPM